MRTYAGETVQVWRVPDPVHGRVLEATPCCEQPTGFATAINHPEPFPHACFNAWLRCCECGDETLFDLYDQEGLALTVAEFECECPPWAYYAKEQR